MMRLAPRLQLQRLLHKMARLQKRRVQFRPPPWLRLWKIRLLWPLRLQPRAPDDLLPATSDLAKRPLPHRPRPPALLLQRPRAQLLQRPRAQLLPVSSALTKRPLPLHPQARAPLTELSVLAKRPIPRRPRARAQLLLVSSALAKRPLPRRPRARAQLLPVSSALAE